jgi:hypothetical protein
MRVRFARERICEGELMSDEEDRPEPGSMRFQDGSTTPREPTLAEKRAREQALRRREAAARQAADDEERSGRRRKRILIGAGVTVGVVALIAVGYSVVQSDDEIAAQCVDEETQEIVDDSNCVTPVANSGSYGGGFYPIFIGGGGRQYHYNYGGTGTPGQRVSGGTTVVPSGGTRVVTSSGRDISPRASSGSDSVTRGGLGVSGGGSSSGS